MLSIHKKLVHFFEVINRETVVINMVYLYDIVFIYVVKMVYLFLFPEIMSRVKIIAKSSPYTLIQAIILSKTKWFIIIQKKINNKNKMLYHENVYSFKLYQ